MSQTKKFVLTLAAAGLFTLGQATAQSSGQSSQTTQSSQPSNISTQDRDFIMKAAQGGMAEVQVAQLAKDKASSAQVKQMADKLIQDHTQNNTQLQQLAQSKGVTVPQSVNAKDQKEIDRLSKLSGSDFDREFTRHMERDHRKDIAEFRREASRGQDTDVKAFASQTIPVLEQHLQMAQSSMGTEHRMNTDNPDSTSGRPSDMDRNHPDRTMPGQTAPDSGMDGRQNPSPQR
jgi:putative membrane protein